jgi:hypothetical protein
MEARVEADCVDCVDCGSWDACEEADADDPPRAGPSEAMMTITSEAYRLSK